MSILSRHCPCPPRKRCSTTAPVHQGASPGRTSPRKRLRHSESHQVLPLSSIWDGNCKSRVALLRTPWKCLRRCLRGMQLKMSSCPSDDCSQHRHCFTHLPQSLLHALTQYTDRSSLARRVAQAILESVCDSARQAPHRSQERHLILWLHDWRPLSADNHRPWRVRRLQDLAAGRAHHTSPQPTSASALLRHLKLCQIT